MGMTFKRDDGDEAYEDYDAYTALNRKSLLRKPFVPYIAAGVVALVAILGFAMYGTSSQNDALAEEVALLAKHLEDIEFRLGNLEQLSSGEGSLDALRNQTASLTQQFQALETKLGQNLNQINTKLAAIEKSRQKQSPSKPTAATKTKAKSPKIHVVKAGETLYHISRTYGLTVDQLKQLNQMGKDITIRPGQKLVVSRN